MFQQPCRNKMKPLLLSLFASILVPVCSEWISREDLCCLDTAVCTHQLRRKFLNLLTFCRTDIVSSDSNAFKWMILRGLRVRNLSIEWWSRDVDALVRSKCLTNVQVKPHVLLNRLNQIRMSVRNIMVHVDNPNDVLYLRAVGSAITELWLYSYDIEAKIFHDIAKWCPNLKKIRTSHVAPLDPLIDTCELDEISKCYLGGLVNRDEKPCLAYYNCSLRRTSILDETAVCLGEGKYYHLATLQYHWCRSDRDSALLTPLLPRLNSLSVEVTQKLFSAAIQKCHNLTELNVVNPASSSDLRLLLSHSQRLRKFSIENCHGLSFDDGVTALAEYCPLLEVCSLSCGIMSRSVMNALFEKCHYLTHYLANKWPYEALESFAVGVEVLVITRELLVRKYGTRLRRLEVPYHIGMKVLCSLLKQNPGLRSVYLSDLSGNVDNAVSVLVHYCPHLTSVSLKNTQLEGSALAPLGQLLCLASLSVCNLLGFTVESVSSMLENKSLTLLSLKNCRISGDMLSAIGRLCPALTSLNLQDNADIQDAAVVSLLKSCSKLKVLSLQDCSLITSEILPIVGSHSLQFLTIRGTAISWKDMIKLGFLFCECGCCRERNSSIELECFHRCQHIKIRLSLK